MKGHILDETYNLQSHFNGIVHCMCYSRNGKHVPRFYRVISDHQKEERLAKTRSSRYAKTDEERVKRNSGKDFRITPCIYYACRIINYVCALLFLKTMATP